MIEIKKKFTYIKKSKKLFIVFPPWTGRFYLNTFLRKSLVNKNYSVLEYEFSKLILSANYKEVLDNFLSIKRSVLSDIDILKKQHDFESISIVGVSLGCINACMIANNTEIKNLYLILPGHCLAESLWEGESTKNIKDKLDDNHSLLDLKKYWHDVAPENNINNLKVDKIYVFLSEADKTIPFDHGEKILQQLKSYSYPVEYRIAKHLKHSIAAIIFYLFPWKFISHNK